MAAEREALNAQFGALELDRWIVTSPLPNPPPPPPQQTSFCSFRMPLEVKFREHQFMVIFSIFYCAGA